MTTRHGRDVLITLLGLIAAAGLGEAGFTLHQALAAARVLVSVGTVGARALSGIERETQGNRRAVNEVLAAKNEAVRHAHIAEALLTDARINQQSQELNGLDYSRATRAKILAFYDKWRSYTHLRERVLSLAQEGRLPEARILDSGPSGVAFVRAAASLQDLRQSLEDFSARQQETVRAGLTEAVAELGALAATAILFVAALVLSRRTQRKFLTRQNHAEQIERERGRILDMTGRNEPLREILQELVSVTQRQLPASVVCVSVIHEGRLRGVVAPGLPKSLLESVYPCGAPLRSVNAPSSRNEALARGLLKCWSQEVLSSAGNQICRVDVYLEKDTPLGDAQAALLEGVAKLAGIVIQHRDMYEQLAFQAARDPLTDLPNRRLFQDRLEQAILRAQRDQEKLGILLIDLDHFKKVNDLLGHRVGDALLREVAKRASGCLRKRDTLSRMGGDEFTVLLNPVKNVAEAEQALRRIAEALQAPLTIMDHNISVSASIGLSIYPDHGEDPATLIRNADLAMYHAKGRARNGWQTYMPELGAVLLRRMSIEKALESAVEKGELELHYQAQTDLTRRLKGAEALLRWYNPDLGQVTPFAFIPVAEESGLIVPIGGWVLEEACRQTASWLRSGFPIDRIAVNISARQLGQKGFLKEVRSALERSGLSPDHLELELTETALMNDLENAMRHLEGLREFGISVAIDDFGTGYSSLFYLQRLPVSRVKIDKSFVQGIIGRTRETLPIIRAIIDLAHDLGLTVIAEGVETENQLDALVVAGCDLVQGYLIHKPQPAGQIEAAFGQLSREFEHFLVEEPV
jgi:diguanylate cyclase (GGDEF)-like protein